MVQMVLTLHPESRVICIENVHEKVEKNLAVFALLLKGKVAHRQQQNSNLCYLFPPDVCLLQIIFFRLPIKSELLFRTCRGEI